MSFYKKLYLTAYFIVTFVTTVLIASVYISKWMYEQKPQSPLRFEAFAFVPTPSTPAGTAGDVGNSSSLNWIRDSFKLAPAAQQPANLLVITSKESFNNQQLAKINGNIVLFEQLFSQIGDDAYKAKTLTDLTQVNYTGFSGATYEDLSNLQNVPERDVKLYEKFTGQKWRFFGEGIILSSQTQILVLRRGVEYTDAATLTSANLRLRYQGIFEITSSPNPNLATFELDLTPAGKQLFRTYQLPSSFPALYSIQRNLFNGYYFAGNFSHFKVDVPVNYAPIPFIMRNKMVYSRFTNEEVFWRWYYPTIKGIVTNAQQRLTAKQALVPLNQPKHPVTFSVMGRSIYRNTATGSQKTFLTGVNLGPTLPGEYFTMMPTQKEIYTHWFEQISTLNVNTLRVYTLLPPAFYQALYEYNLQQQQAGKEPLYFLQELWPEEKPADQNYLGEQYDRQYAQEIAADIDAVHGNAQIPTRKLRSSGLYSYDVSPYLIGYLVGREMEPDEVIATDTLNAGYSFRGEYFYSEPNASPTEAWLAANCDAVLTIENQKYHNQPLVSIVNWPTLDPIEHPSEWANYNALDKAYNDRTTLNINNIGTVAGKQVGFFGSYHIYPNYPDFMNNDPLYAQYQDQYGEFRYGGYLRQFMQQHTKYPAVVAEYGISTSSVTAHLNPNGLNHGGLSEAQQSAYIVRMTDTILREGYSGAIIFEWMDEWVKKTWTNEFYMIPYDRHVLWHNTLDPEQNYGLLSYEAAPSQMSVVYHAPNPYQQLQQVQMGQNASYIELSLIGAQNWDPAKPVSILLSTVSLHSEDQPLYEFALTIGDRSTLVVNPGYNWLAGYFASTPAQPSQFQPMIQTILHSKSDGKGKVLQEQTQNIGELAVGPFQNNLHQVWFDGKTLHIRLPYELIGISDPSSRRVLYDPRVFTPTRQDEIATRQIRHLSFRLQPANEPSEFFHYTLQAWEVPTYTERLKDGFSTLAAYYARVQNK